MHAFTARCRLAVVAALAVAAASSLVACSFSAVGTAESQAPDGGVAIDHDAAIGPAHDDGGNVGGHDATVASAVGTFDVEQGSDSDWYFHVSASGATLLTSDGYSSRTSAINGALSTMTNGSDSSNYDVASASGGYVVEVRASNNDVLATTGSYATSAAANAAIATLVQAVDSHNAAQAAPATGPHLQMTNGEDGYWFGIMGSAGNGDCVLSSQSYSTMASAYNAAYSVRDNGASAASYDIEKASSGGTWSFTLRATNNAVMGTSPPYANEAAATSARDAMIAMLPEISVL